MALLDAYTKPLTANQVAYLLRRATFGPTSDQVKSMTGQTAAQIVTKLLTDRAAPPPPLDLTTSKTFHDQPFDQDNAGKYNAYLNYWWANQMLNEPASLLEKTTLFWSNHFVTNTSTSMITDTCIGTIRCCVNTRWVISRPLPWPLPRTRPCFGF